MTEQLRDTLTRIAEQAEPAPADPTLWSRARRSRRRSDLVAASAVGAAVFALVVALGVLVRPGPDAPDPAPADREGIPSIVRGVLGDGGLPLETDLAVGIASTAVVNPSGAFVVTADDGVYHRLDLPGFDPSVYDDPEVRRTGMVGLRLSPDGLRLAYGYHGPLPEQTGQEHGFVTSGVRIVDLDTGAVETLLGDQPLPAEYMYYVNANDFQWATVPYGLRWSPDGRYLTYDQVWSVASTEGEADTLGQRDLQGAYHGAVGYAAPTVVDTRGDTEFFVRNLGSYLNWGSTWPSTVGDSGVLVDAGLSFVFPSGVEHERSLPRVDGEEFPWTVGLVDRQDRVFMETELPSSQLLAVDLPSGAVERLDLDLVPVRADLLGWIGQGHALAEVRQGDEAHLTVLDLSDTDVESNLAATIDAAGTDSTFSFATDLASVKHPTRNFATPPDGDSSPVVGAPRPGADAGTTPDRAWLAAGLLGGVGAAALALAVVRRRIRA